MLDRALAEAAIGLEHDFGVGFRPEGGLAEAVAQVAVVVDFAVRGNGVPVRSVHRLITGRQIDDAQPHVGEADTAVGVEPGLFTVGARGASGDD